MRVQLSISLFILFFLSLLSVSIAITHAGKKSLQPKQPSNFKPNTLDLNQYTLIIKTEQRSKLKAYGKEISFFLKQMRSPSNKSLTIELKTTQNNTSLAKNGAFSLNVGATKISITAKDSTGIYYALNELEKIKKIGTGKIKMGDHIHQPKILKRILHLVLSEKPDVKKMKSTIDLARYYHYNHIIIQLKKHVQLQSMEGIATNGAWSKNEFLEVVNYAKEHNLKVIPEINFLTHQKHLFSDPSLLYTNQTYNPSNKKVYELAFKIIDELCQLIQPEFFHIGHDELYGLSTATKNSKNKKILPAKLFLYDIQKLNTYIGSKNVKTMMWGDMFLYASDFPEMNYHPMHANLSYKNILPQIPKNIIICDWHYFDKQSFSTINYFTKNGFVTYGATWWRLDCALAFTNYIYKNVPYTKSGIITTTWPNALNKVIQKNSLSIDINQIIRSSGEAMWLVY